MLDDLADGIGWKVYFLRIAVHPLKHTICLLLTGELIQEFDSRRRLGRGTRRIDYAAVEHPDVNSLGFAFLRIAYWGYK